MKFDEWMAHTPSDEELEDAWERLDEEEEFASEETYAIECELADRGVLRDSHGNWNAQ